MRLGTSGHEAALGLCGHWQSVGKSITPSTDSRPVYLEYMELACQTSALAISHAMVTSALPRVSTTRIGNNHKCQDRERMGRQSRLAYSVKTIGWQLALGPRQLRLLPPPLGTGELMWHRPPLAPSVDLLACIIHPLLPQTLENGSRGCQNSICAVCHCI